MSTSAQSSVQVAWDPNLESNIAGYKLYYGVDDSGLTNLIDVGSSTTGSVSNLAPATTYYFYVTAYNDYDLESDPSTVLYYTSPVEAPVEGPAEVPIILTIEENLLALAPAQLRLPASLEGGMEESLEINWQQLKGPHFVAIQDPNLIQPTVALSTVSIGKGSSQAVAKLDTAYDPKAPVYSLNIASVRRGGNRFQNPKIAFLKLV